MIYIKYLSITNCYSQFQWLQCCDTGEKMSSVTTYIYVCVCFLTTKNLILFKKKILEVTFYKNCLPPLIIIIATIVLIYLVVTLSSPHLISHLWICSAALAGQILQLAWNKISVYNGKPSCTTCQHCNEHLSIKQSEVIRIEVWCLII